MSYELDNLKREVDSLKWQKAENYKLESLETTVRHLAEALMKTTNIISGLEERIWKLEQKLDKPTLDMLCLY
jgi:chromosome segregation ATPase